jgi:caa(3)-type oxidase subunit IV
MSEPSVERASNNVWFGPVLVWLALLVLLAGNIALAQLPASSPRAFANLVVAAVQVMLMFVVFMRLNRSSALVRLTAGAAFFWMVFLFTMSGADFFTRPS